MCKALTVLIQHDLVSTGYLNDSKGTGAKKAEKKTKKRQHSALSDEEDTGEVDDQLAMLVSQGAVKKNTFKKKNVLIN